jgi:hypothetical protein
MKNLKTEIMNPKLIDLEVSIRLLNVLKRNGYGYETTINDLKALWSRHIDTKDPFDFRRMKNFGLKSFNELKDILTDDWINEQILILEGTKTSNEIWREKQLQKKIGKIKQLVKQLHKESFYNDEIDIKQIIELNARLSKLVA